MREDSYSEQFERGERERERKNTNRPSSTLLTTANTTKPAAATAVGNSIVAVSFSTYPRGR